MDYKKILADNKTAKTSSGDMAKKLYLSFPTDVFRNAAEVEFEIINRVANQYRVPISSVHIIGSAKTGFSLIKGTQFKPSISDLDLAIVDSNCFKDIWEEAHLISNGFSADRFQDPVVRGERNVGIGQERFLSYIQRGIIAPEFLPTGRLRSEILQNNQRIGSNYTRLFGKISVFFYLSEFFFKIKLQETINKYWEA